MKKITKKDKRLFLESHFSHEVELMVQSFLLYVHPQLFRSEVVMEAFLIHVRNFYEFFYINEGKNNAHAVDYIPKWKVKKKLIGLKRWNTQINNYLLHLSYERNLQESKPYTEYKIDVLYNHFREVILDFWEELPKYYKKPYLTKLINNLKEVRWKSDKNSYPRLGRLR